MSASSGTASSSASPVQDLPSSSSIAWRSDERAPGNWREAHQTTKNQNKEKDDNRDSDERSRDLREWLQEFPDNLENTEMPVLRTFSDSDSEHSTRVVSQSRKHSIFTHFPKDWNCFAEDALMMQCLEQLSGTSCRKIWWLDNSRSQSPQWEWWLTKQSSIRCRGARSCHTICAILSVQNQIFSGDGKEFTGSSSSRHRSQKLLIRTVHWNVANLVKNYHVITERPHLIDPRQIALLREPFEE